MTHGAIRKGSMVAAIGLVSLLAWGVDAPDLRINLISGLIETVDATWSGTNYNIRYTVTSASGQQNNSLLISSNAADDLDPRIAINAVGDAYVAWWRDAATDSVIYRKHNYASGAWGSERAVGLATENNSRPRIVIAGKAWVAYQIQNSKSRSVGAQIIDDDPEPVRTIVASTSFTGNLDIQIQSEAGHLWITWVDAASKVGYSEYGMDRRWTAVAFESFSADSIAAARARIRARILNIQSF